MQVRPVFLCPAAAPCNVLASRLQQRSAEDQKGDCEVDHQPGDINQRRDKGAELVAGSKPSLRNRNGNMLPVTEPKQTTPTSVSQTVKPTSP